VPERNVIPIDDISLDHAAMVEFLSIGAHAVRRAQPRKRDRVLVVGAGPIGLGVILFAELLGCSVTALDIRQDRLDFCQAHLRVDHIVHAGPEAPDRLATLTNNEMFDIVFDATGNSQSMIAGFDYVAHGGAYVLVSVVLETISFADPKFHAREMTLLASRNATAEDFQTVLRAIRGGQLPLAALLSHRAALDESPERFAEWLNPEARVIKALIEI